MNIMGTSNIEKPSVSKFVAPINGPEAKRVHCRRVSTEDAKLLLNLVRNTTTVPKTDVNTSSEEGSDKGSEPWGADRSEGAGEGAHDRTSSSSPPLNAALSKTENNVIDSLSKQKPMSEPATLSQTSATISPIGNVALPYPKKWKSRKSTMAPVAPIVAPTPVQEQFAEEELDGSTVGKKLAKNRLAAKRCRERKKQYISYLEQRIAYLESTNVQLDTSLRMCEEFQYASTHHPHTQQTQQQQAQPQQTQPATSLP